MARFLGVEIPNNKKLEYGLRYVYGIGPHRAKIIAEESGIDTDIRIKNLSEEQLNQLASLITSRSAEGAEDPWLVEGDLRRHVTGNLKRLQAIKSNRGIRHQRGLPVRGQRTRTNARTRKGGRKTVGVVRNA
ncbi:MAG: 30S ribosomal protein S13 [Opitutales bacterium]|nr:30S ribosomal protein S13 [Opitutales bacterium]|tara:strand:- start:73 stop:468 length:396 start_codon:yes stop_codon:yes gene_type:complete